MIKRKKEEMGEMALLFYGGVPSAEAVWSRRPSISSCRGRGCLKFVDSVALADEHEFAVKAAWFGLH